PGGAARSLEAALQSVDPTLPYAPNRLVDLIAETATRPRLYAQLFAVFAGVALGLSSFGIYASLRFTLHHRVREIGVRLALGATPLVVTRWILGGVTRVVAAGLAVGSVMVVPLVFGFRSQLHGTTLADWWMLAAAPVVVAGGALLATVTTAWRASHQPPSRALQCD
ncbi:MAG TPA: FtsX-like permease family protein, partial [Candidatus Synoicihabitans sp.]|nr:FtsX-like permease family protein [Candidatus Synoicihabitans sp.]